MIRFGLRLDRPPAQTSMDELRKAREGFSRGRGHKYVRRVRTMQGGKLIWKYYYADDIARERGKKHLDTRQGREREAEDEDAEHVLIVDFKADNPDMLTGQTPLKDLTTENVPEVLEWEQPPKIKFASEETEATFHTQLVDKPEAVDPHGQPMAALRVIETAFDRMPPRIRKHFSGAIRGMTVAARDEDPTLKRKKGWAAYARGGGRNTDIVIGAESSLRVIGSAHRINGGLWPVGVVVHEMGHAIHNMIGAHGASYVGDDWDGPSWQDFMDFYNAEGKKEPGVTRYAETNPYERWAESFACALMYPQQLAETAPKMYEFMRTFLGEDALPPLNTDLAEKTRLENALVAEKKRKTPRPAQVKELLGQLDALKGILDMGPDNPAISWWTTKKETELQSLIRTSEPKNYATDAVSGTFHPDDKFYEMNVGGRTILMRIGPKPGKAPGTWDETTWEPTHGPGKKDPGRLLADHIKEVYDADGKPLDRKAAWWYLHQDIIGERTTVPGDELVGRGKDLDLSGLVSLADDINPANRSLRNSMNLHEVLGVIGRDDAKMESRPVEISSTDFRRRSGAFAYSAWSGPGDDMIADGAAWREKLGDLEPGTKAYRDHWAAYLKQQPSVAFEELTATQWHVDHGLAKRAGQVMGRRYLTDNGIPRLTGKRFINDNPDGSQTVVTTTVGPDGRFYISNPVWRELLTPNGGDVKGPDDLRHLCQQAMEAGLGDPPQPRRAWVSIRADEKGRAGPETHYMHMQVEFDGRGQPKVLGEEWRHLTGQKEPRLDDLLEPARDTLPERRRARLIGERIKRGTVKRKRKGRALLPTTIGERAILKVTRKGELGLKTAKEGEEAEVVVRVARIIPGKKKGEAPSPPGWDRMPEGFDEPYPGPTPGEDFQILTEKEREWVEQGLLPETYAGTSAERDWLSLTFEPATKKWKRTLKSETKKEYPSKYIFIGEARGGAGRKMFIRTGDQDVIDTISYVPEEPPPESLTRTPLVYVHKTIDPRTGDVESMDLRMLLPKDGHLDSDQLDRMMGVNIVREPDIARGVSGAIAHIVLDMNSIPRLREELGGMSLTGEAEEMLRAHAAEMRELAERAAEEEHVMPLEDIDPLKLAQKGVGLKGHMSDGTRFVLAHHQQQLVQKLIDNGGRVLGAHFMGTGKTVSAIVAAKLMMARSNPNSPMYDPSAPKKTLVVAPLNVVEQWRQAAAEFDDGATVVGAKSSDIPVADYIKMVEAGTDQNDLVIVGPEYFTQHAAELKKAGFDALVVDEAHMGIKDAKTKRNKAISSWNPDMKMMMLLTGTPITTSPSDILEYIKILSNGQQWAGMTRKKLEETYLEASPVPGEAGVKGKTGPKVQIKASKRDELAAILAKWVHVAMAKDVRGKTLPAVRIEESRHAEMIGIQAQLYALQLAALPDAAKDSLRDNSALGADEMRGLDTDARRRVQAAKAIANCPAYKPASTDKELMVLTQTVNAEGKMTEAKVAFHTFGIGYLKKRPDIRNARLRKKAAGRWPPVDELTPHQVLIYNTHFRHVIDPDNQGLTYEQVAGQKISKSQWKAMERRVKVGDQVYEPWGPSEAKAGGPSVANPDAGPLGIRFRGVSHKRALTDAEAALVDRAVAFRRTYAAALTSPSRFAGLAPTDRDGALKLLDSKLHTIPKNKGGPEMAFLTLGSDGVQWLKAWRDSGNDIGVLRDEMPDDLLIALAGTVHNWTQGKVPVSTKPPTQQQAWAQAKDEFGIAEEEAQKLMGVPPEYYTYDSSVTYGGVTVTTDDEWVSDKRGSLHLLYRKEDWDPDTGKPKVAGGFDQVRNLDRVEVTGRYGWLKAPAKADEDWTPPVVRYRQDLGENKTGKVAVEAMTGDDVGTDKAIKWVSKKDIAALVPSLMDPGRREERARADLAMVMGNAKAEELMAYVENFHIHTGNGDFSPGDERSRSMVIFANGILDGCRTVEATLRVQGFRDVNEVLSGSPHHDETDAGPAPNGKYFVTYIGGTYTGDRELNIEISRKLKDKLGRDTDTSLFVHKVHEGRKWKLWPGAKPHGQIQMSQWTGEQRARIFDQFKIRAPEAHFRDDKGKKRYFYGTTDDVAVPGETVTTKAGKVKPLVVKGSAGLLREIVLTGDPSKMPKGPERDAAEARIKKLGDMYEALVREHSVLAEDEPPMTAQQINVMNNTEIMVLSDAAQVGINKGDAVELVMYDSLASPMAEMQRITRSARMLPPAVRDEMMNKYITNVRGLEGGDFSYAQLQTDDPEAAGYAPPGAKRIDHLWAEMQRTGQRPSGMSWVDYKTRAERNGAKPGTEQAFQARGEFNEDAFRDANRITWEVNGKVAVEYTRPGEEDSEITYVSRSAITETDGPFRRIRDQMEAGAFDPKVVGAAAPGQVIGASVFGEAPSNQTFGDVLKKIAATADEAAESTKSKVQAIEWRAISARARGASTLGVMAGQAALREFAETKVPGETGNILGFNDLQYEEPTAGTYGLRTAAERAAGVAPSRMEESINEPINAIREILEDELSPQERTKIAKAGFVQQGESGSLDATEIYMAMRASQIMARIDEVRPQVGQRMRAAAGGKIVTEADIMNTIIDELSPMDRAILKSKKYLVNVRRMGVSAHVPSQITTRRAQTDPMTGEPLKDERGGDLMETVRTFAGYEKQHPIATERNTRAIGRARVIPVEGLLHAIQTGVQIRSDMDFSEVDSSNVADMSRLDVVVPPRVGLPKPPAPPPAATPPRRKKPAAPPKKKKRAAPPKKKRAAPPKKKPAGVRPGVRPTPPKPPARKPSASPRSAAQAALAAVDTPYSWMRTRVNVSEGEIHLQHGFIPRELRHPDEYPGIEEDPTPRQERMIAAYERWEDQLDTVTLALEKQFPNHEVYVSG